MPRQRRSDLDSMTIRTGLSREHARRMMAGRSAGNEQTRRLIALCEHYVAELGHTEAELVEIFGKMPQPSKGQSR